MLDNKPERVHGHGTMHGGGFSLGLFPSDRDHIPQIPECAVEIGWEPVMRFIQLGRGLGGDLHQLLWIVGEVVQGVQFRAQGVQCDPAIGLGERAQKLSRSQALITPAAESRIEEID